MMAIPLKSVGRQNDQKIEKEFTISRGELLKGSKGSYAGVLHANTFKVDKPIALIGVSFFGPEEKFKDREASYRVTLGLVLSDNLMYKKQNKTLIKPTSVVKVARRGRKFRVDFPQVIILKPYVWYDVLFELNGPETAKIEKLKIKNQYSLFHHEQRIVTFNCFIGSCQMPDFHFAMADENIYCREATHYSTK